MKKGHIIGLAMIFLPFSGHAQGLIDDVAGGGVQTMQGQTGGDEDLDCYECDLRSKQEVLYDDKVSKEKDQVGKGIKEIIYDPYNAPFINVRNLAGTTIFLPIDESIEEIYIGDPTVFQADYPKDQSGQITRKNVIKVSVNKGRTGADTPLTLLGKRGKRQYKFILSSFSHDTDTVPDFWVDVVDPPSSTVSAAYVEGVTTSKSPASPSEPSKAGRADKKNNKPDWIRAITFDPTEVRTDDYEIALDNEDSREIAPDSVWHDNIFTYLKYNEDRSDIMQRPAILQVIDDYNSPVTTEAVGEKSNIIAVRSVGRNLFLGNGDKKVVCILWKGANTRRSEQ
ncbi:MULTISPECIES: TrbG/VirB9 family P-type conjugative transfer protein [Thalassospira]|jgi:type IV secretory pathway VirB9-like protein|uniref:Conjugal transfer protein TrbG n=1 Tax=Thalassospira marina TaxID=2048283 RepID=A0A2N3KIN8_9PROT|nr:MULTISPECIES: TrbG/VirB9 family P-type conjugative transfer protein [Thalassospira]OSQ39113.1 hypothetical protein THS27_21665 [Thalassospira sp. MCCC 1A01428]PKR50437.1 hypothetical protein COO20_21430 [Thalassospira marina]|tara:strand:- start:19103 stop:20119 length:1017 start_codon:yes stop_codon:yes gene_type:complete